MTLNVFGVKCDVSVDFVVVTSAQINHDVLVTEKEHTSARIVQLVHLNKV